MDILKFITAGSVDSGKSTLIGRLLYDTDNIYKDQLDSLQTWSEKNNKPLSLSQLTDGLTSEREQGITIDVAYKYFSTEKRKFIIADSPGHEEFTRNMVTAASNARLAIILIDSLEGITHQTRKHIHICSFLGIKHIVACINKMDDVDYSQTIFQSICTDFIQLTNNLGFISKPVIPISASLGLNIVKHAGRMTWYKGPTLIQYLETIKIDDDASALKRFPVQLVLNFEKENFITGNISSGLFNTGDKVKIIPSGKVTRIKQISIADKEINSASTGTAVSFKLSDGSKVKRGDYLIGIDEDMMYGTQVECDICWFDNSFLEIGNYYTFMMNHQHTGCKVKEIVFLKNIKSNTNNLTDKFKVNDMGRIVLTMDDKILADAFHQNPTTGRFILVCPQTNNTIAAGLIIKLN